MWWFLACSTPAPPEPIEPPPVVQAQPLPTRFELPDGPAVPTSGPDLAAPAAVDPADWQPVSVPQGPRQTKVSWPDVSRGSLSAIEARDGAADIEQIEAGEAWRLIDREMELSDRRAYRRDDRWR